jgi:hypothetical protein
MDSPTRADLERRYSELAAFCFRKMASLEGRFLILCQRAQAVGIDCSDLTDYSVGPADTGASRTAN